MEESFSERFGIVYKKYVTLVMNLGSKPSEAGLARFLNVSQTTMQRWKKGQIPSALDVKTIHDKLGFAYDWLISGEGEMFDGLVAQVAEQKKEIERLKNQIHFGDDAGKDSANGLGEAGAGQG